MRSEATVRSARYYYVARTVHLERLQSYEPAWFFYSKVRADFDPQAAAADPLVRRAGVLKIVAFVLTHDIRTLEVAEPLAVRIWPQLLLIHASMTFANRFKPRDRRVRIVSYAIENLPADRKLAAQFRIPEKAARFLVRTIGGFLTRTTSTIVFGTQAAEEVYRSTMPDAFAGPAPRTELVWALPTPLPPLEGGVRNNVVVFLGTFEHRKGIHHLLRVWPTVLERRPDAKLLIMGKGADIEQVRSVTAGHDTVELLEDPARAVIFERLHGAKTLVLHSQPTALWKEQVGLPILEALGSGCEIVSSDETGIAGWLQENGHQVLPVAASDQALADAIVRALDSPRTPAQITRGLPTEDSRLSADRILFGGS